MKKNYWIFLVLIIFACQTRKPDPNYLGYIQELPIGEYVIYNYGSRHIVRCERKDGRYYCLNDANFPLNGIAGRDAHEYRNKTKIRIE